jgi:hypothetical protein
MIIAIAAAGTALAVATPAATQYYPQPQQPYNNNNYNNYNGYGRNNWGQVRSLEVRLNNVERQINRLDRRDRIGNNSADRLRDEANRLEQRLRYAGRGGFNPNEANDINVRIARLEQRVQYAMQNRNGRYGWNNNGYNNGQFVDRDRDGRDDRYEDDRGHDHDD